MESEVSLETQIQRNRVEPLEHPGWLWSWICLIVEHQSTHSEASTHRQSPIMHKNECLQHEGRSHVAVWLPAVSSYAKPVPSVCVLVADKHETTRSIGSHVLLTALSANKAPCFFCNPGVYACSTTTMHPDNLQSAAQSQAEMWFYTLLTLLCNTQ